MRGAMAHTDRPFVLSFITPSPSVALAVLGAGADRVVVDLESSGKVGRQGEASSIHGHTMEEAAAVAASAPGKTFVRVDSDPAAAPVQARIAVSGGAAGIIVPMYRTVGEVREVRRSIGPGPRLVALAETVDALRSMGELLGSGVADEVHFGLRDLSIELGLPFMFQAMLHPLLLEAALLLRSAGFPFMTGGIAPPGRGLADPLALVSAHAALGSHGAFMSRDFGSGARETADLPELKFFSSSVSLLRERFDAAAAECRRDTRAEMEIMGTLEREIKGVTQVP